MSNEKPENEKSIREMAEEIKAEVRKNQLKEDRKLEEILVCN